jgi:hypothetical protein
MTTDKDDIIAAQAKLIAHHRDIIDRLITTFADVKAEFDAVFLQCHKLSGSYIKGDDNL